MNRATINRALKKLAEVEQGHRELEYVPRQDQEEQLPRDGRLGVEDARESSDPPRNENDRGAVHYLAHHGRSVVPQPQVSSSGESFPEMEEPNIGKLCSHVGNHRGQRRPEGKSSDFEEDRRSVCGVQNEFPIGRIDGFEPGQNASDPENEENPAIQQEAHPDNGICPGLSVDLADQSVQRKVTG